MIALTVLALIIPAQVPMAPDRQLSLTLAR